MEAGKRVLHYAEEAHDRLGLSYAQVAAAIGTDEGTLHRWLSGEGQPGTTVLNRLDALHELQTELLSTYRLEAVRDWVRDEMPALEGKRPIDLLTEGRIELLTRILMRMNLGHST